MLAQVSASQRAVLDGRTFFPSLISGAFADGLHVAFDFAIVACLVAAWASWLRGGKYVYTESHTERAPSPHDSNGSPGAVATNPVAANPVAANPVAAMPALAKPAPADPAPADAAVGATADANLSP